MNKALRKAVIAGNWKMNKTPAEAKELLEGILPLVKDADCDVVACVPFVDLSAALETAAGSNREDRARRTATGSLPALTRVRFPPRCLPP